MKKFVFCIMTALLLISCIPVGAFADGIQKTSVSEDGGSEGIFTVDYYMDPELSEFSLSYGTQTTPDGEMIWYPRYHSWGVMAMRADFMTDYISERTEDRSVTVAVLDSGVNFTHQYLNGRLLDNGYDFVNNDSDPTDDYGHGTSVAGIIADYTSGLNVDILPVKVLDENGRGDSASVASGIYYVIEQGADVISFSATAAENSYSEPVDEAITAALEKGIIFVAAAGNEKEAIILPMQPSGLITAGL